MKLLDKIDTPADLKLLKQNKLPELAREIRELIIDVTSKNGGHLASSLGAVELTIALHYVFNCPDDKIVWDVGHQAYAHKILTGRRDAFARVRTHNGISGFTKSSESDFDAFTTGHSSTSISASLGMACAKRLKNDDSKAIAVIGDGSMTAGVAYEAMNQAGGIHKDMIVILNDNDMSISPNVGALSSLLSRTFSAKAIQNFKKNMGNLIKSVPRVGDNIYNLVKKTEDSFKTFVTPGMLFEAFNFDYFGPIDGHNLEHLITMLDNVKNIDEPVLLHVITQKGKGYLPAEKDPVRFHGIGPFITETGETRPSEDKPKSYTEVFGDAMIRLAEKDDRIVAVTAAMPDGTGLVKFAQRFPDRFFDVGIAEQHAVIFAAGLASEGYKPVVAIYSTFLQRAYDQVLHDVCIESLPVVFAMDRGGIVGEDGPTHQGLFDLSYLRHLPNMTMMAPKDENEFVKMLELAVSHGKPIAVRYPRGAGIGVSIDEAAPQIPLGRAETLLQGDDILILAVGDCVNRAVKAAKLLKGMTPSISATVVNARFVKPLDKDLVISLAKKINKIITVEENVLCGGFGGAVIETLIDAGISDFRLKRLGIEDKFVEHGPGDLLRKKYGIDVDAVVEAAKELLDIP